MLVVRMAKATDILAIAKLEQEAFGSQAWSEDALMDAFLQYNYRFMVAEEVTELTSDVVGYMGMYLVVDEANVTNIAVFDAHKRKGIGTKLLNKMMELAKHSNCVAMTLEVRVSNEAARALYTCAGFESSGIRKGFYHDPTEDAEIMWCHFA